VNLLARKPILAEQLCLRQRYGHRKFDEPHFRLSTAPTWPITGLLNLTGWPARIRVIARHEVPHPGAQLRPVDHDARRITCFPPDQRRATARPKLRHRRRARAEDRIHCAKDTGLANLPLHDAAVWLAIVLLAYDPPCSPGP
jgi:hypothetical protein